jgi:hypothetical protein
MYFRLFDHYADFPEDDSPELNECLICLEINTYDNLKPINLKTQQIYFKNCNCGGWVHLSCLCEWHDISNSCPICRLYMKKPISLMSIFRLNFINYCATCIFACIRLFFLFWFVFAISCSYHIYKSYFILNHRNNNKYENITE